MAMPTEELSLGQVVSTTSGLGRITSKTANTVTVRLEDGSTVTVNMNNVNKSQWDGRVSLRYW
jgi:preprotein translocase subunit YajC